jgi:hypothetical protein
LVKSWPAPRSLICPVICRTLVVGGPYSELCDQVLLNALALRRDRPLRGLTLLFVAPDPPSPSVTAAASAASAQLYHRKLP